MNDTINFFFEEINEFSLEEETISTWINTICNNHNTQLEEVNYILCSDDYLLNVNREYLDHDYYTDIITFDNSEEEGLIEGDIFISIDRVKENATEHDTSFDNEFRRVMAHGILHLIGFKDKTEQEAAEMRKKEDESLSLYPES